MNDHRKTFTNIALVSQVKRTKYNIGPVFEIVYYNIIVRFIIVLPPLFSIVSFTVSQIFGSGAKIQTINSH